MGRESAAAAAAAAAAAELAGCGATTATRFDLSHPTNLWRAAQELEAACACCGTKLCAPLLALMAHVSIHLRSHAVSHRCRGAGRLRGEILGQESFTVQSMYVCGAMRDQVRMPGYFAHTGRHVPAVESFRSKTLEISSFVSLPRSRQAAGRDVRARIFHVEIYAS